MTIWVLSIHQPSLDHLTHQLSKDGQDFGLEYRVTPFTTVNTVPLSWRDSLCINAKHDMSDSFYTVAFFLLILLGVEAEV
jgi:hypothetical protein